MRSSLRFATLASLTLSFLWLMQPALAAPALKPGDPAPPLRGARWLKGKPVSTYEKGKVYVLEFWATWCGPCIAAMPRLTALSRKYAGKAIFVGVNVWDQDKENRKSMGYLAKVADFVRAQGGRMGFPVAVDGPDGPIARAWLEAANQQGIPTAFVIDQQGKVAWICHSTSELDEVVGNLIAGTFDRAAAGRSRAAQELELRQLQGEVAKAAALIEAGQTQEGLTILDGIAARKPEYKSEVVELKFVELAKRDEPGAYQMLKVLSTTVLKDDPKMLNQLAYRIARAHELKHPNYTLALSMAQRASALTLNADPRVLNTVALALFHTGRKAEAIRTQERALELARKPNSGIDTMTRKALADQLSEFKM